MKYLKRKRRRLAQMPWWDEATDFLAPLPPSRFDTFRLISHGESISYGEYPHRLLTDDDLEQAPQHYRKYVSRVVRKRACIDLIRERQRRVEDALDRQRQAEARKASRLAIRYQVVDQHLEIVAIIDPNGCRWEFPAVHKDGELFLRNHAGWLVPVVYLTSGRYCDTRWMVENPQLEEQHDPRRPEEP